MVTASVGIGYGDDAFRAGSDACRDALRKFPNKGADIYLVFASVALDQDRMLEGVRSVTGESPVVGCSTAGEITTEGISRGHSVVVMAIQTDQIKFYLSTAHHIRWNAKRAGGDLARGVISQINREPDSFMMFLDGVSGNTQEALQGVLGQLGASFPIAGVAAADDLLFKQTYQYFNDKVYSGSLVGLGLVGDFKHAISVKHGWMPIGLSRRVTKAEGTRLIELDGKPAMSIYKDYFGEDNVQELRNELLTTIAVSYPLGIVDESGKDIVIRNPIVIDDEGAITFTADIPVGAEVRLMIGSKEEALEQTRTAAREVRDKLGHRAPSFLVVFSSASRRQLFGAEAEDEISVIQDILGRDTPMIGFYGYGEVGGKLLDYPSFHNAAVLIYAVAE